MRSRKDEQSKKKTKSKEYFKSPPWKCHRIITGKIRTGHVMGEKTETLPSLHSTALGERWSLPPSPSLLLLLATQLFPSLRPPLTVICRFRLSPVVTPPYVGMYKYQRRSRKGPRRANTSIARLLRCPCSRNFSRSQHPRPESKKARSDKKRVLLSREIYWQVGTRRTIISSILETYSGTQKRSATTRRPAAVKQKERVGE